MADHDNHLGGCFPEGDPLTFMPDVWGYLMVKHGIRSVLDIGCGYGHALRWFIEQRCTAIGTDGFHPAADSWPDRIIEHDFCNGPAPFSTKVDLVWSAEFLEHIEEQYLPNVMPLFQLGKYACITHAEPGQPGYHHVNCMPDSYWVEKFAEYGMEFDRKETEVLRRTDRGGLYGRKTLMFFVRN